jgi:SAM domain (Sterile alpha motif)
MPNLPIFSQSNCVKENSQASPSFNPLNSIPFNSSISNTMQSMLPFFFIPFTQHSNNNDNSSLLPSNISSSPQQSQQSTPSLEEFFSSLDSEFEQFKNIFENERITVDQIYDLTDIEFNQLGINKIGWRKVFRAAAQRYKK